MPDPARTTMTRKGQVTIPRAMREWGGLKQGRLVEVAAGPNGAVEVRPVADELTREERLARIDGFMAELRANRMPPADGMTTDEYMATIREPLPLDPD